MLNLDRTIRILFCGVVSLAVSVPLHFLGLADARLFFPGAWLLSTCFYAIVANLRVPESGKAVLVTGCDSGFGQGLAIRLRQLGFRVFAGCLKADAAGEGAERLRRLFSDRMHVLQLDITKEEEVSGALHEIKRILPGSGRIVNVTSVEGRMAGPLVSAYDLTKFAMEGFSDSLRHEMRRFGVNVCLVEPGNFTAGTNLNTDEAVVRFAEEMWCAMDDDVKLTYGKQHFNDVVSSRMLVNRSGETDVTPAIEAMVDALTQRFPQARYIPMGLDLYLKMLVAEHLPEWVRDHFFV
ncbi:D-beta-hydroxybutyrate dehydrogenase, mitochondrial-like isoform X3 [Palaemon carinicauda]|uniref:D-beta-hydroxybutyrate dehydrogenase, mitochondrial-like isoform X3 n=1 Tax=Palaemon carinicauda TaxID=392227 RepID=UPI0035B671FE